MSVLDVGTRCYACALVDFLPFHCPSCTHTFCSTHVQSHDCAEAGSSSGLNRRRTRRTCALPGCETETIESIGGLEGGEEDSIARQVRCLCGEAYCIASQEAHDCPAPRELSARHDAVLARREKAQDILAQNMPSQAGKERLTMPKQVDKTRRPPGAPVAAVSASEAVSLIREAGAAGNAEVAPPPSSSSKPPSSAEEKLHKVRVMKMKSLAKPLDPKVARADCCAVEWGVDENHTRVKGWAEGKYAPSSAATALCQDKPERIWIPLTMPGGKLHDMLVARAKHPRAKNMSLVRLALQPGVSRVPVPCKLDQPAGQQMETGDVLLLG